MHWGTNDPTPAHVGVEPVQSLHAQGITHTLRTHREIVLVLLAFIALGALYSVTTPLFEAPDEQWHFAFVQNVATGHGLPVQVPGQMAHLARQEGSQPPLYYLLAAGLTFWINTADFPGIVWENPHYGYDVPGVVNDNKNLFVHTSLESFPYRGAVLAIHLARGLSILMGALAVFFTYLLTLEILPGRRFLAAAAGALVAFIPQFLFISSAVSNDSTIVALTALSLWMMVRLLGARFSSRDLILLGAATGFAALAKVSGAGLALLAALVLAHILRGDRKRLALSFCIFGATVFLVAGWWYLRNWVLYGELTGTEMMVRIFGARQTPLTGAQWVAQLNEVWETFWVGLGWGNIRANPIVYSLLGVLVGMCALGLLIGLARRRNRAGAMPGRMIAFGMLVAWIGFVSLEFIHWMNVTQAPHGRLFFPALPALGPLAVLGVTQWLPKAGQPVAARAVAVGFFGLGLAAPFAILQPAYTYPTVISEGLVPVSVQRVDITYGNQVRLLGYEISPTRVVPNQSITLTLYWQGLVQIDADYSIGIVLQGPQQQVIGSRNSYPGHGMLPTRLWQVGQVIRDTYWVPVAADAPAPTVAELQIALYTLGNRQGLAAVDPSGQVITPIIGRLKIAAAQPLEARPQHPVSYLLGKEITLLGYDQGDALALYWKRIAPVTVDYTVFVHVLDSNGEIVKQQDRQPAAGENPTSLWEEGEVVLDKYPLKLDSLPPGKYVIELGMYRAETNARLAVTDAVGREVGDHIELGPFEIGR